MKHFRGISFYFYIYHVSDFEVVNYKACSNNPNDKCPKCKPCAGDKKDAPKLRRMQEVADSVWNRKRRYTPEVLKIRKILRRMQAALDKNPTRTTRTTYKGTTAVERGKWVMYG